VSVREETSSRREVISACFVGFSSLPRGVGEDGEAVEADAKEVLVGVEEGSPAEGGRRTKESAGPRRESFCGEDAEREGEEVAAR
jgi:hypothetical protein